MNAKGRVLACKFWNYNFTNKDVALYRHFLYQNFRFGTPLKKGVLCIMWPLYIMMLKSWNMSVDCMFWLYFWIEW